MKIRIILTLGIAFLSHFGYAQDFDKAKLDSYFEALEANNKFMGSVAVSQDGQIIYTNSIGYADMANEVKADENTKYRIGSISKTFTAVLALKGVEEGKVNLDQTIDNYFSDIQNANKITVGHLLNHRSGIHNFTNDDDYLTYNTEAKSENEMLDIIRKAGSDFEPGSRAAYSNSNYVLLTYILEKSFEKPYAEILAEYITEPIGLTDTYLGGEINLEERESNSYRFSGEWKKETETDISIPLGAGGIVSTPSDLVRFSDALFSGKLINEEHLDMMKTFRDNYGMGLFQVPFHQHIGFGHTGGIDGFTSVFSYFADGDISYAMVSNGTRYNNNDISIAVLSAVFDKPFELPNFTAFEVSSEDLDKYLGVYSSPQFPLKITITKKDQTLMGQATGQPSFPLEASEKDKFRFDQAGLVLEFNPEEESMVLKQGGGQHLLKRE